MHEERELKRVRALLRPLSESHVNPTQRINKSRFTSVSQSESNSLSAIAKEHPRLKHLFEDWKAIHASNESFSQFVPSSSPAQSSITEMHFSTLTSELYGGISSQNDMLLSAKASNSDAVTCASATLQRSASETASSRASCSSSPTCTQKFTEEELNKMRQRLNPLQFRITQLKDTERY